MTEENLFIPDPVKLETITNTKEEYCDIGYQGKYQCWELKEIEK